MLKIMNGNGEKTTNQPKNRNQPDATNGALIQPENPTP